MNIVVAIKHIPSIADDLPVKGVNVDFDSVDFVLNEFDEQSIEQAVLVKEAVGGTVTVVGVDMIGELDNVLHLALAKGADKAVKITGDDPAADSHQQARWLSACRLRSSRRVMLLSARCVKWRRPRRLKRSRRRATRVRG